MVEQQHEALSAAPPATAQAAGPGAPELELTPPRLRVRIVTGDRAVYDGVAERVVAPAVQGRICVLLRHAPLLAMLEPGELLVATGIEEQRLAIGGGFIEVADDEVTVLADSAERPEEIDVARALAARQRAQALMKQYRDRPEAAAARQALRRSMVRLRLARREGR